jgi:urease accessory protein
MTRNGCLLLAFTLTLVAGTADAHPVHAETGGGIARIAAGFRHPLGGWDHLVAMVAVGVWAAQIGGLATWLLPLAFVSAMMFGGVLAGAGVPLPIAEQGVLSSVFVLGLLVVMAVRLSVRFAISLVALFAVCHGHAHVAEMPAGGSIAAYAAGFVTATTLLHLAGIGLGMLLASGRRPVIARASGGALTHS